MALVNAAEGLFAMITTIVRAAAGAIVTVLALDLTWISRLEIASPPAPETPSRRAPRRPDRLRFGSKR